MKLHSLIRPTLRLRIDLYGYAVGMTVAVYTRLPSETVVKSSVGMMYWD